MSDPAHAGPDFMSLVYEEIRELRHAQQKLVSDMNGAVNRLTQKQGEVQVELTNAHHLAVLQLTRETGQIKAEIVKEATSSAMWRALWASAIPLAITIVIAVINIYLVGHPS